MKNVHKRTTNEKKKSKCYAINKKTVSQAKGGPKPLETLEAFETYDRKTVNTIVIHNMENITLYCTSLCRIGRNQSHRRGKTWNQ